MMRMALLVLAVLQLDLWLQPKPAFNIIVCFVSFYLHDSSELEIK